jgi:IS30 family transposase
LAGLGLSPLEIAKQLGVNKSTVTRWMKAGKLSRAPVKRPQVAFRPGQTPAEWAKAVRESYDLDPTDDQLVTLAESALRVSLDPLVAAQVQLAAAGRFQALVRQLALIAKSVQAALDADAQPTAPKPPARQVRPRSGVDPRNVLMAVK